MLRVRDLTHNPEDERSIFLRNFWNKLPNHTMQQPRRPSSTITRRKPQIIVFVLFKNILIFLIILSFSFIVFSLCIIYFIQKYEPIKYFIIFGRSKLSGVKVQNTLLTKLLTAYSAI